MRISQSIGPEGQKYIRIVCSIIIGIDDKIVLYQYLFSKLGVYKGIVFFEGYLFIFNVSTSFLIR